MTHSKRSFLVLAALLAFSTSAMSMDMIGNCELTGAKGSIPIATPAKAGQLTVQVSLPAPIWWNGDTPEAIKDGMEYCMAAEIAWRAGYDKLEVVNVGWDPLVAGQTAGYRPHPFASLDHRRPQEGGRFLGPLFQLRYRRARPAPMPRSMRQASRRQRSACSRRPRAPPSPPTSSA